MNKPSRLAAEFAGALMVVSLFGASAFAESRHHDRTQGGDQRGGQSQQWQGRSERGAQGGQSWQRGTQSAPSYQRGTQSTPTYRERAGGWNRSSVQPQVVQPQQQRGTDSYQRGRVGGWNRDTVQTPQVVTPSQQRGQYNNENRGGNRGYDRNRGNDNRGYNNRGYDNHGYNNRGYDNHGYNNRGYDNRGYNNRGYDNRGSSRGYGHYSYPSRGGRSGVVMQGRVSRMYHDHGGYRVWLDNGYSWWVPEARFRLWPLRVGLSIRLGGWWNPLGYYDAYDFGPYDGPFYTSGDLHGVVESVDYYRGTVVLRDDVSGGFVTAVIRGGDPRLRDLRPGDYVDVSGAWTGRGYFDAYQLQDMRQGGYDDGYAPGY